MKKTRKWHAQRLTQRNIVLMIVVAAFAAIILIANRQERVLAGQATVIDGDTIRLAGEKVRLQGLAAPELHEPGGIEAKNALIELIRDQQVTCQLDDVAGQDVAAELVRWGFARDCPRFSKGRYRSLEPAAAHRLPLPGYCAP